VLPYINLPDLHLGPIPVHWFGILVAIGVLIGIWLARRRAPFMGIDPDQLESFINWMLLCGFVLSHVLDTIFYHPDELVARPWSIFMIWEGLSSFGGLFGAAIGIFLWKRFRGKGAPIMPYADLILSVYPVAWIFGRMGCAVVHDHKGMAAAAPSLLTVAFPDGPHYDLGMLEMLYTIFIAAVCASLWRKKLPTGTYVGLTCVLYAPVRFMLDFLRVSEGPTGDPRYFGLTPGQWACVGVFIFGLYVLIRALRGGFPAPEPIAAPAPVSSGKPRARAKGRRSSRSSGG
jgi:phosphatidylglycerol:prolipoprotein diacylglycerol transferase